MRFRLWLETNELAMPKLFERIKQLKNEYSGVHFSPMNQLSFNLNPSHHDPIGIYVFPKEYVLNGGLKRNQGFASKYYAFIIEPTSFAKILNLNMSIETAEQLLEKIGLNKNLLRSEDIYHNTNQRTPGHLFWGVLEHIRTSSKMSKNVSWNTLFAKTGFNALYDPGLGVIHSNEPMQIVYLDHKAYKVIDVLKGDNKHSTLLKFASFFPEFRINKRKKSGWGSEERIIRLEKDGGSRMGGVEISVRNTEHNLDRLVINVYGFNERFSSKEWTFNVESNEDLAKAADEVRLFMNSSERAPPLLDTSNYDALRGVSKLYGLKIDPEFPGIIQKRYKDNTKFDLVYTPSKNSLTLSVLKSNSKAGTSNSWVNYFYYYEVEVREPEESIKSLIEGLKVEIRKDAENENSRKKYDAPFALKFVEFLESKVFIKRIRS